LLPDFCCHRASAVPIYFLITFRSTSLIRLASPVHLLESVQECPGQFARRQASGCPVQAAEETYFPELASHQLDQIRSVLKKSNGATDVFRAVVDELAISEELPAETVEIQNTVAEFLNRHFIVERRAARLTFDFCRDSRECH
jgi:hypothetical protein